MKKRNDLSKGKKNPQTCKMFGRITHLNQIDDMISIFSNLINSSILPFFFCPVDVQLV